MKPPLIQVNLTYKCNRSCSYCFAKDLELDFKNSMSLEDFKGVLGWLKLNNLNSFNITGGEPTLHPLVNEMLSFSNANKFNVSVFTNGLFGNGFLESIGYARSFLVNYNHESTYTKKEYELLHENLDFIRQKGKPLTLAFNMTHGIDSCGYVIDAAKKYGASVHLNLTTPNSLKNNDYIHLNDFQDTKALVLKFLADFKKNNIHVKMTRPLPFCIFKDVMRENKGLLSSSCSVGYGIVSINPDLSIFPCLALFFKGPKITSFSSFDGIRSFYSKKISDLKWANNLFPECASCIYVARKKCQGSCLCHKCS